jgi:hypothetical protein
MHGILFYFGACVVVGLLGSKRTIGFWGFFIMSTILSPVIPLAFLLITAPRGEARPA